MNLKAGSIGDAAGSMVHEMEEAFKKEWPKVMKGQPVPEPNDQMRLMFAAIAQGVVNYLSQNHDAFKVTVSDGTFTFHGSVTKIDKA